jgi:hypothetical protein
MARLPRFLRLRYPRQRHQGPGDQHHLRVAEVVLREAGDEKADDRGQAADDERALPRRIFGQPSRDGAHGWSAQAWSQVRVEFKKALALRSQILARATEC